MLWHLRAFVYGAMGFDAQGQRSRTVSDSYVWPEAPDAAWQLVVCSYPDGELDLDFAHPISRRFWSEDNGFIASPEERVCHFDRQWYEQMGFEVIAMMSIAKVVATNNCHLRVA